MRERAGPSRALGMGLLALVLAAPLPGCRLAKRLRSWFRPAEAVELARGGETPPQPPVGASQAVRESSFVPESERSGLEVRLMVVDDTRYDAPRLLDGLTRADAAAPDNGSASVPALLDERTRDLWASWGFRLIPAPIESVDPLLEALTPLQPSSVQWLGEFGAWRAVVRAGELRATRVRVGDSFARVEAGRPTLIARSWVEPVLSESGVGSAVRVDLGMQMQQNARPGVGFFDPAREPGIEDSGPVLDALLTTLTLPPGRALVIVAEAPGVSWDELPEPVLIDETAPPPDDKTENKDRDAGLGPSAGEATRPALTAAQEQQQRTPASRRPAFGAGEPRRPEPPSLGELMLMTPGSRIVRVNETRVPPKRVIVVLVPRTQGAYRLLPPVAAGAGATP